METYDLVPGSFTILLTLKVVYSAVHSVDHVKNERSDKEAGCLA